MSLLRLNAVLLSVVLILVFSRNTAADDGSTLPTRLPILFPKDTSKHDILVLAAKMTRARIERMEILLEQLTREHPVRNVLPQLTILRGHIYHDENELSLIRPPYPTVAASWHNKKFTADDRRQLESLPGLYNQTREGLKGVTRALLDMSVRDEERRVANARAKLSKLIESLNESPILNELDPPKAVVSKQGAVPAMKPSLPKSASASNK